MLLTRPAIQREIEEGRLLFDPPLSDEQIGASSIDLRLGNSFMTFDAELARQRDATGMNIPFDVARYDFRALSETYGDRMERADGEEIRLEPWRLMLGWTKERITLQPTLAGRVEGKSKAARVGLMVHLTAPSVHAGWVGNLQLEFLNVGPAALVLRPGIDICQLILEETVEPAAYEVQFQDQRQP